MVAVHATLLALTIVLLVWGLRLNAEIAALEDRAPTAAP